MSQQRTLKIFISWSGERSKLIAIELRRWLPKVIQAADPWMSDTDIHTGRQWFGEIANQLEQSDFGIICLTPENLKAPWLLFEAGALSKRHEESFVIPYAYRLALNEIPLPLSVFHGSTADRRGL